MPEKLLCPYVGGNHDPATCEVCAEIVATNEDVSAGDGSSPSAGSADEGNPDNSQFVTKLLAACKRRAEELGMPVEDLVDRIALELMAEHGIPERIVKAAKCDADRLRAMMNPPNDGK